MLSLNDGPLGPGRASADDGPNLAARASDTGTRCEEVGRLRELFLEWGGLDWYGPVCQARPHGF